MHTYNLMPTVGIKTQMILIKVPHSITNLPYNKIIRHYPQPYKYTLQIKIKFRLNFFVAFSSAAEPGPRQRFWFSFCSCLRVKAMN